MMPCCWAYALRALEVRARLGDLPLEELAGVGRGFVAPLKRRIDEALGDSVCDDRRELRRGRLKAELDQLAFLRDLGLEACHHLAAGRLQPARGIARLRDELGVVAEA